MLLRTFVSNRSVDRGSALFVLFEPMFVAPCVLFTCCGVLETILSSRSVSGADACALCLDRLKRCRDRDAVAAAAAARVAFATASASSLPSPDSDGVGGDDAPMRTCWSSHLFDWHLTLVASEKWCGTKFALRIFSVKAEAPA